MPGNGAHTFFEITLKPMGFPLFFCSSFIFLYFLYLLALTPIMSFIILSPHSEIILIGLIMSMAHCLGDLFSLSISSFRAPVYKIEWYILSPCGDLFGLVSPSVNFLNLGLNFTQRVSMLSTKW